MMNKKVIAVALALALAGGSYAQDDTAKKKVKAYMVSDAHLDTQWNWDLTHTIREYIPRILFQNLWMLERYPDYKFNFEGGIIYRWMKEYYPLHYARLQKYIDEGRWHISGHFHFSVQPWSTRQLMETDHWHKMQAEDGVWITLDGLHMGVGGDDSWTPSVLPQWLLSQTRWQYEVSLRCL